MARPEPFSTPEIAARVDSIMATMTLEEKIAQIQGIRPTELLKDGKLSLDSCRKKIPNGIGHMCQFSSSFTMEPEELRDFVREVQRYLMTQTRLKIPAVFHEEAITGFSTKGATTFPQQIGIACSWNPEMATRNALSTRKNMKAVGANYALSPMLDVIRTAHWPRIEESYGEDPYLTSTMGVAFVKGLQGDDFKSGITATTKHFAGYGAKTTNEKDFFEDYLMPHEAVIKVAGVKSVMPSYAAYKGVADVANPELLNGILRGKMGFDGIAVSDYHSIDHVHDKWAQASSFKEAGVMALKAGNDLEFPVPKTYEFLPEALEDSTISIDVINTAVKRSLTMKIKLGLLDNPVFGVDGELDFDPPANRKLAYEAACQSIVLLKNNGILPLKVDEIKDVALLGPNSDNVFCLLGDYTYQSMITYFWGQTFDPNSPKIVSIIEGLENKLGDKVNIHNERGCDWTEPLGTIIDPNSYGDGELGTAKKNILSRVAQPDLEKALSIAQNSDVIIAAMGENTYLCGENREREGIRLPGEQELFVEKLIETGKPVILVITGGRQQLVDKFEDKCAAIVQAWFPGEEAGNALADLLVGNVNPSAKLCVSYPKDESEQELNYQHGYKDVQPQYPFGYGLSYTTYAYSDFSMPAKVNLSDAGFTISCTVENTGSMDGAEIVQLYVSPVDESSSMDPIQLKGFKRVNLKAGKKKTVVFTVFPQQLMHYLEEGWKVEAGSYEFKIGASSVDIPLSGTIQLEGDDLLLENRNTFFSTSSITD
ncbi:glycoside hydrolase family 3 N-terminal domain-containing protein [Flammeovirgaceae bacterium SG7u.111]|nr:glycoside hydrolase family 3 N-terminal domain-containing protein [Flammeovirgaceae bacterium SG7u.132]WPO33881.1 glycoside hydrolase family 3 N-terminal domain-containing protein [Flammeovirgaceae bacterium SG7u.111]